MPLTALLTGGSRDGQTTEVADDVTRIYSPSDAPGLLDVYEATGDEAASPAGELALVFAHVGQESAAGIAPQALHLPPGH